MYCSDDCQHNALASYHKYLCKNSKSSEVLQGLQKLHEFIKGNKLLHLTLFALTFDQGTSFRFALATRVVAMVISTAESKPPSTIVVENPRKCLHSEPTEYHFDLPPPFEYFCHASWVDFAIYDPETKTTEADVAASQVYLCCGNQD